MRILLVILFLIPSLAFGTRVQSKAGSTGAGAAAASLTITLTSNATVGNTLIVAVGEVQNVASVKYGASTFLACSIYAGIALCHAPVNEVSNSIVVTPASSSRISVIAVEYSGIIMPDNAMLAQRDTSGTTNPTATLTADFANELVVGGLMTVGTFSSEQTNWLTSITNSFASVVQTSTSSNVASADRALAVVERFATTTGTYSTSGTQPNSSAYSWIQSFVASPTPTATPTATATNTPTPTATATASFTPCAPTPTNTPTATPSATFTPSATATASFTPCAVCSGVSRARVDNPQ